MRVEGWDFMKKYYPSGSLSDVLNVLGYAAAQTLVQTLKQCGDDLTRQNVMRQAASLTNLQLSVLLPGITINTSPRQFAPIRSVQLQRFNGKEWERFGSTIDE